MKKIASILMALALVLSLTGMALAADQDAAAVSTNDTTLVIPTGIKVFGTLASVYAPEVEYTYTIEPATIAEGAKVTDADGHVSIITAGPADGATLLNEGKVHYTGGEVASSTSGVVLEPDTGKELTVSVDLSKFSKPGVYRYKITDATAKGTLDAAGLTRDEDYNPERYLDVYIHYSDDDTPVLEVYGYVLAEANNTETTVDTESKTVGYTEDEYHTIDVTLEKVVTGSMGDTQHEFPFSIVITNNDLSYYGKENETPTVDDDSSATSITVGLKSGDKYYLTGLSPKATVTYTETNDTADTYELTITGTETTITPGDIAPLTGTQTTGALAVSTYEDSGTQVDDLEAQNEEVVFTNNLDEVSPTGLVLRVAPYALILAAGIALLMISRRRKTVTE